MDRVLQLQQKRAASIDAAQAILDKATEEDRELTAEEREAWDGHAADADRLKGELKIAERQADMSADISANPPKGQPGQAPAVHTREVRPYSLLSALRASAGHDWSEAKVERRASDELAELLGRKTRENWGFHVPFSALMPIGTQIRGAGEVVPLNQAALEQRDIGKVSPHAGRIH
jgi:HK97 family phage major capsid protein